jgi:hypothetical protein
MSTVGLQPASSTFARANFEKTLRKPIKLEYVLRYLSDEDARALQSAHDTGAAYVWGVKYERVPYWAALFPDECLVLFRQGGRVVLRGIITFKTFNPELAEYLWGTDEDGQPWGLVYFLRSVYPLDVDAAEVNQAAGFATSYPWRGFITIWPPEADRVIQLVKEVEDRGL